MRRARLTYPSAWHHVTNRGINKEDIFLDARDKRYFLKCLRELSVKYRIVIAAYCLMSNHYHMVLKNISGKMSEFMKSLNSQYATYFRKYHGGRGYLFQNRYYSTLIQDNKYLMMAIIYTLVNPVRAGLVERAEQYEWSSYSECFHENAGRTISNTGLIRDLFGSKNELRRQMAMWGSKKELGVKKSRFGAYLGDDDFYATAEKLYDRRKNHDNASGIRRRKIELRSDVPTEIIKEVEKRYHLSISRMIFNSRKEREIRDKVLVALRDEGGMKYSDISGLPMFRRLKTTSLAGLYRRAKNKMS